MGKTLYHGTTIKDKQKILKEGIKLNVNHGFSDFGSGFYLTPNKGIARDRGDGSILAYDFNSHGLNKRVFSTTNDMWKNEIYNQRVLGKDGNKDVDYVIGPIADGNLRILTDAIINGEITRDEFDLAITKGKLPQVIQIAIKTQKAVDQLQRLPEKED